MFLQNFIELSAPVHELLWSKKLTETILLVATITDSEKIKGCLQLLTVTHFRAKKRHLPHAITQCYLLPDTGERAPP